MEIREWFETVVKKSAIETEKVDFSKGEIDGWKVSKNEIIRNDRKYYKVVMLRTKNGEEEYYKPMIEPFSKDGIYGLLVLLKINGKYLIQAKAEAGNKTPGNVVLTVSIQSSYENLKSGKVSYSNLIDGLENKLQFGSVPQDGGMLYRKNNTFIFAEIEEENFEVLPNFFLASREEISSFAKDGLVSEHLIQLLGLLWLSELN